MHLIAPLAAGVSGAENGTAELYRRGTSTRATWYATFEAEGQDSTGADIPLDANGGVIAYVGELVNVIVKDTNGTPIREFVAGAREDAVEVQSPSFTGIDYETGQSAPNNPTTLAAVLDRVFASFGSIDWNVNLGGQSVTIVQAIAGNIVVNVKAEPYNAKGDGVNDDTAAINAAIAFANSVGGGTVYFPAGEYRITDTLDLLENVSLLGVTSSNTSTITRATSDAAFVTTTDSSSFIRHLTFQDADTGANEPYFELDVSDVLHLEYVTCLSPADTSANGSPIFNDDCGGVRLRYCQISIQGPDGRLTQRTGAALVRDTQLYGTSVFWVGDNNIDQIALIGITKAYDCTFSYLTDGTAPVTLIQPYQTSVLVGNAFTESTTETALRAIAVDVAAGGGTANSIVESGTSYAAKYFNSSSPTAAFIQLTQPLRTQDYAVATGASVTITGDYGVANVVTSGGAGAVTLAFDTLASSCPAQVWLVLRNPTAANHTVTTSGTSPVDAGVAVNAGLVLRAIYSRRTVGGTTAWFRMTGFTVSAI